MKIRNIPTLSKTKEKKSFHIVVDQETFLTLKMLLLRYDGNLQNLVNEFLLSLANGEKLAKKIFNRYLRNKIRLNVDKHFKRYKIYNNIKDVVIQKETMPKEIDAIYESIEKHYVSAINEFADEKEAKANQVFDIQKAVEERRLLEEQEKLEVVDVGTEIKRIKRSKQQI